MELCSREQAQPTVVALFFLVFFFAFIAGVTIHYFLDRRLQSDCLLNTESNLYNYNQIPITMYCFECYKQYFSDSQPNRQPMQLV